MWLTVIEVVKLEDFVVCSKQKNSHDNMYNNIILTYVSVPQKFLGVATIVNILTTRRNTLWSYENSNNFSLV